MGNFKHENYQILMGVWSLKSTWSAQFRYIFFGYS